MSRYLLIPWGIVPQITGVLWRLPAAEARRLRGGSRRSRGGRKEEVIAPGWEPWGLS